MELANRIFNLRKSVGLNQESFGKRIGVTRSAVCNYETGSRAIGEQIILAVCREFNVNEKWLRTGEGEMFCQKNTDNVISEFMGDILTEEPNFRRQLISLLARMSTTEWIALERKAVELVDGLKDNVKQAAESPATPQADPQSEIAELRQQVQAVLQQNQELKTKIEALEQEDELQNPWSDSDAG